PPVFEITTSIVDFNCELGYYTLKTEVQNGSAPFSFELLDLENNIITTSNTGLFSNVTSGDYKVRITDAENLINEGDIINLTQHVSLEVTSQLYDTECANEIMPSLGIVVNGGLPPYSYSLDSGSYTAESLFVNLEQGEHTYTVLDSNGCTITDTFVLDCDSEPTELSVNAQIDAIFCDNKSTIVALADGGTAPYSYELFNSIYNTSIVINSTGIFDNLEMSSYFVIVKDVNNISVQSDNIQTIEITPLNATTVINQVSCIGQTDGSIEINVEGGSGAYEFSIDQGTTFQTENVFENLSEGNYEIAIRDAIGCSLIISAQLVSNELCSDFTLAADNFTIESTGESCASSNNGSIVIRANENLEYNATLSNASILETKSFRTFSSFQNLMAGAYELCITVTNQPNYNKCFTIYVTEPETLKVGTDIDESGKSVSLSLKGGDSYFITLNGTDYSTTENKITLPLSKMTNTIEVKTNIDCQGVFKDEILTTYESVTIYPNPIEQGDVTILLPNDSAPEVLLTLFSQSGIRVREKLEKISNRTAKLNMDGLAPGVYTIIITTENQNNMHQIIKK
ncbi:MAG: T9SS type A sorting domain-containing protein, partial [Maribacter sp.]